MVISKKAKKWFVSVAFVTAMSLSVFNVSEAHPGRTDSSGGHNCRTNCESYGYDYGYHYHNGGGSSSSSSSYAEQQREAQRQAERDAEAQRKKEEQQRIQNEQSKKQGYDAGYQAGLTHGQQQSEFNGSVENSNSYYQQGYSEGYPKGYDEGELKFFEEQRKKAEEERKKAEEERRLAEERQKKEEFLAIVYDTGIEDGESAFNNNKGITEYPESINSYNEEQKQKYIEGYTIGWEDAKTYKESGGIIVETIAGLITLGLFGLLAWGIAKLIVRRKKPQNYTQHQTFNAQQNPQQLFSNSTIHIMDSQSNINSNQNQDEMIKKGVFGCLGCFGIIIVFGVLFSGCVSLFSDDTPENVITAEVLTVENQ